MFLKRVLTIISNDEFMYELLDDVFDKNKSFVRSLNDVVDQYCIERMHEHKHNVTFEAVIKRLFIFVEKMLLLIATRKNMKRSRSCRIINKNLV